MISTVIAKNSCVYGSHFHARKRLNMHTNIDSYDSHLYDSLPFVCIVNNKFVLKGLR